MFRIPMITAFLRRTGYLLAIPFGTGVTTPEGGRPTLRMARGAMIAALLLSGCAKVPLGAGSSLSSTANLRLADTTLTKTALYVDQAAVLRAQTVRIVPTTFTAQASADVVDAADRRLVGNAVDRALCAGLSDRFAIVDGGTPADITVHATVTEVLATNATVAGVSAVASLGAAALSVPATRLPFGLGGLGVEAEAVDRSGTQVAAMIWARGANSITERARMSAIGDAYGLAFKFGGDFSRMMNKGASPFGGLPALPSGQKIHSDLGGSPRYVACEVFGRAPGLSGILAGQVGLSPRLTDRGAVAR